MKSPVAAEFQAQLYPETQRIASQMPLCALTSAFLGVVAWINIHKALRIVFGS